MARRPPQAADPPTEDLVGALGAAIVSSAMDAIVGVDETQRIVLFNPAAELMFGRSGGEVTGQPLDILLPERFRALHRQHVDRFEETGTSSRRMGQLGRIWGLRSSGEEFPIEASISQARSGGRSLLVVVLRDLTERERTAARLREAQELASLGTLIAGIAHDIGTPMSVVLGYAELLEDSLESESQRERVRTIRSQTERVVEMIRHLLSLARPEGRTLALVPIDDVLEHGLAFLEQRLERRQIGVERDFAPDLQARVDGERLERAFLNLFMNAADAMAGGGTLRVVTRPGDDGAVEISISDSGAGILPEHLGRIFEPFFTTKAPGQGSGLGLLVTRGIVLDHGGAIDVRSEPGKGTEFRIVLPRDGGQEDPEPSLASP